ncbi:MAG TPA: FtsX-like permease family protein [Actinoplanes sp.]|nr:FtsX-like permease family protein [Actinoplanes sp.]
MKPSTLLRLGLAGTRTDRLRTVLTALSATLAAVALLAAATVAAITGGGWVELPDGGSIRSGGAARYTSALLSESGLRPGVITALLLLALPVLALAGQCVRLGAPARDRRLAAIRLAGATPRQAVLIASAETAVASAIGSLIGSGVFLVLRDVLHRPYPDGRLPLPTDILPSVPMIAVCLLFVPVLAGAISALLLRRVIITPIGVVRRVRERHPWPWPGVLIVAGLVVFAIPGHMIDTLSRRTTNVVLSVGVALTMIGVVLGVAWISYVVGRLLLRFGRRPAMLLAARRLIADPWNGSRTQAALLAGVIAGAIAIGYRQYMITEFAVYDRLNALAGNADGEGIGAAEPPSFYLGAVRLVLVAVVIAMLVAIGGVLVALAESIVARRRAYAALTAVGVPRRTLSESIVWHTFAPLLPGLGLALVVGTGLVRLIGTEIAHTDGGSWCRGTEAQCRTNPAQFLEYVVRHEVRLPVPIAWDGLALVAGVAVAGMLLAVAAALAMLRSSTDLEELRAG